MERPLTAVTPDAYTNEAKLRQRRLDEQTRFGPIGPTELGQFTGSCRSRIGYRIRVNRPGPSRVIREDQKRKWLYRRPR